MCLQVMFGGDGGIDSRRTAVAPQPRALPQPKAEGNAAVKDEAGRCEQCLYCVLLAATQKTTCMLHLPCEQRLHHWPKLHGGLCVLGWEHLIDPTQWVAFDSTGYCLGRPSTPLEPCHRDRLSVACTFKRA